MDTSRARPRRVASEIMRLVNDMLLTEIKDPRLAGVRVNEVEVSGDLGVAKIYFGTVNPDDDPGPALEGFGAARGFIRSKVGKALGIRRAPELRFIHDERIRGEFELRRLIEEARRRDESGSEDAD